MTCSTDHGIIYTQRRQVGFNVDYYVLPSDYGLKRPFGKGHNTLDTVLKSVYALGKGNVKYTWTGMYGMLP